MLTEFTKHNLTLDIQLPIKFGSIWGIYATPDQFPCSIARLYATPDQFPCSGQVKLATVLESFQYKRSDSFGVNPPLY